MQDTHPELMGLFGVYAFINKINNRRYVGSTRRSFRTRKYNHVYLLNNQQHHSPYLQAAWSKYGPEVFTFAILEVVDDRLMVIEREQAYINERAEYNATKIAGGGRARGGIGKTNGSSFYKGVYSCTAKSGGRWRAAVSGPDGKLYLSGWYKDELEAAIVYDQMVRELFPNEDYANFPKDGCLPNQVQQQMLQHYYSSVK